MRALQDSRPVVITGSTTTGKTDVAWNLARRLGTAAVITTVPYYMHAQYPFHYGIGLTPSEPPADLHTYLYKSHNPREPKPSDFQVVEWVRAACSDARSRGLLPILEGASPNVTRLIVDRLDPQMTFVLYRPGGVEHATDIRRRVAKVAELLMDEVREVDNAGLGTTWLATYGDVYEPAWRCTGGEITKDEMVMQIASFMTSLAHHDNVRLSEIEGQNVVRVPCGRHFQERTVDAIYAALEQGPSPDLRTQIGYQARPITGTAVEIVPIFV